jgi:hypothetical protein
MKPNKPGSHIPDFNVKDLKDELADMKVQINDAIKTDPDYTGEADLLLCVIENLSEEIKDISNVKELNSRKQARVLADMALFNSMLSQMFEGEGVDDEFDFDDEECDDECDDESDEEETHGHEGHHHKGGCCGGHHHHHDDKDMNGKKK